MLITNCFYVQAYLKLGVDLAHRISRPMPNKLSQSDRQFNSILGIFFGGFPTNGQKRPKNTITIELSVRLNTFSNLTYFANIKILDPPVQCTERDGVVSVGGGFLNNIYRSSAGSKNYFLPYKKCEVHSVQNFGFILCVAWQAGRGWQRRSRSSRSSRRL